MLKLKLKTTKWDNNEPEYWKRTMETKMFILGFLNLITGITLMGIYSNYVLGVIMIMTFLYTQVMHFSYLKYSKSIMKEEEEPKTLDDN